MGLNVNLKKMFGLPAIHCPQCKRDISKQLTDFDIECDEPKDGVINFFAYCNDCEAQFEATITFNPTVIISEEKA